ncbi:hypothetical protein, partial [Xenorhabdus littoralis]|uniref:hypothetical protein n=1 Tax=Xenorhabdus littoralis TaxID=2582835 RepID=UPI0029E81BF7
QGQLIAKLTSQEAIRDLLVSLSIEGKDFVDAQHPVSFIADPSKYHIQNNVILVNPSGPLMAHDPTPFTYTAVVLAGDGRVLENTEIKDVKWKITQNG